MELLWLKFVEDTFVIWKYSSGELQLFLHNLNMRTTIKCTMKKERDSPIQFLNVWIMKVGTSLKTTVYRKPAHTGQHLQFKSNHLHMWKKGWYRTWCIGLIHYVIISWIIWQN